MKGGSSDNSHFQPVDLAQIGVGATLPSFSMVAASHSNVTAGEEELPLALSLTFDPKTNLIDFTLFEHTVFSSEPVPLHLKYEYRPECGYAPSQSSCLALHAHAHAQ
jgi:hypothetical protein